MRFCSDVPRLEVQGQHLALHSPYNAEFVADLKSALPYNSRKWDGTQKVWLIDPAEWRKVRDLILQHYAISIPTPTIATTVKPETRLLQIKYIGSAKDRGDGTKSAFGWMDGWTVLFPLRVLRDWFEPDNDIKQPDQQSTLYAVLGVRRVVPGANLRKAYRRAARQWHPDVCSEPDATQQFQRIQQAYEVLSDPAKRARYDAGLKLEASFAGIKKAIHCRSSMAPACTVWVVTC